MRAHCESEQPQDRNAPVFRLVAHAAVRIPSPQPPVRAGAFVGQASADLSQSGDIREHGGSILRQHPQPIFEHGNQCAGVSWLKVLSHRPRRFTHNDEMYIGFEHTLAHEPVASHVALYIRRALVELKRINRMSSNV